MRTNLVLLFLTSILLSACSNHIVQTPGEQIYSLPDLGKAPELTNTIWLNTPEPLRLKDLRGKVVLLDMWTFG